MFIKDLLTGDIVVLRNGNVGFFVEKQNEGYIIYQTGGYDCVDVTFNDDLTDATNGGEFDVVRVYRACSSFIFFNDYCDGNLIFER